MIRRAIGHVRRWFIDAAPAALESGVSWNPHTFADPSGAVGMVSLTDELHSPVGGVRVPTASVEQLHLMRPVGGEIVFIEVHTDRGPERAMEVFIAMHGAAAGLLGCVHPEPVGGHQDVARGGGRARVTRRSPEPD